MSTIARVAVSAGLQAPATGVPGEFSAGQTAGARSDLIASGGVLQPADLSRFHDANPNRIGWKIL